MPNVEEVCDRIDNYSDRLSTQIRTLAVGLLAFSGGLIVSVVSGGEKAPKLPAWLLQRLFLVGVLALLALACDLAQYGSMYLYMRAFQRELDGEISEERENRPDLDANSIIKPYDESDVRFRAGRVFFGLKALFLLVGVLWMATDAFVLLRQGGM